jgi:hypothetical protein
MEVAIGMYVLIKNPLDVVVFINLCEEHDILIQEDSREALSISDAECIFITEVWYLEEVGFAGVLRTRYESVIGQELFYESRVEFKL